MWLRIGLSYEFFLDFPNIEGHNNICGGVLGVQAKSIHGLVQRGLHCRSVCLIIIIARELLMKASDIKIQ
jgi:hypothetical protein